MEIKAYSTAEKELIRDRIRERQADSSFAGSANKFARHVGLASGDLSILYRDVWKEEPSRIGPAKWVKLARVAGLGRQRESDWVSAATEVHEYITQQLSRCQADALAAMLVDEAGIGKTHSARRYAEKRRNAFYLDCSTSPRKIAFVRQLASTIGLSPHQRVDELVEQIILALQRLEKPIVILDEAGDLEHAAILVLKRLYNALEGECGFYLLGSDGFRSKIERGVRWQKLGFAEFFSRFGRGFRSVLPPLIQDRLPIYRKMARQIAQANGVDNAEAIARIEAALLEGGALHDMRRVRRMILKEKELATINRIVQ